MPSAKTRSKKKPHGVTDKVFTKKMASEKGAAQELELTLKQLREALDPSLSESQIFVPGYNCQLEPYKGEYKVVPIPNSPDLYLHHLTPHYEKKLLELLEPIIAEFKRFLGEVGSTGDEEFNWDAQLTTVLSSLLSRMLDALEGYTETFAMACSIICEASITLAHRYKHGPTPLPEKAQVDIDKLNFDYFYDGVPADFMLKYILIPQYSKLAIADRIKVFFSMIISYLSTGMGNLIQKQIS